MAHETPARMRHIRLARGLRGMHLAPDFGKPRVARRRNAQSLDPGPQGVEPMRITERRQTRDRQALGRAYAGKVGRADFAQQFECGLHMARRTPDRERGMRRSEEHTV